MPNIDGMYVQNADGTWSQNMQLTGRKTSYQRVLVSQSLSANGLVTNVINTGLGTHSIQVGWKCSANVQVLLYGCDASGNALASNGSISTGQTATQASLANGDWGGAPYLAIVVAEKSGAANTINFVDVWWTLS